MSFLSAERSKTPDDNCAQISSLRVEELTTGYQECGLCGVSVETSARHFHVVKWHLKKPLFYCPYCTKSECFRFANLSKHIANAHFGQKLEILSTEDEHEEKIERLSMECFGKPLKNGKSRQKRAVPVTQIKENEIQMWRDSSVLFSIEDEESGTAEATGSFQKNKIFSQKRASTQPKTDKSTTKSSTDDDATCELCNVSVKSVDRLTHIVKHHLKRPMFFCPYCDASEWTVFTNMKFHVRNFHPKEEPVVLSTADYHKKRLADLLRESCFGIRFRQGLYQGRKPRSSKVKVKQVSEEEVSSHIKPFPKQEALEPISGEQVGQKRKFCYDEILDPTTVLVFEENPSIKKRRYSSQTIGELEEGSDRSCLIKEETCGHWQSELNSFFPDENNDDPNLPLEGNESLTIKEEEGCAVSHSEKTDTTNMGKFELKTLEEQCQLCGKMVSDIYHNRRRHVLVSHLQKPVGFCLYCCYTSMGDFSHMVTHVRTKHKGEALAWTDKRQDYEPEIRELMLKCFPNLHLRFAENQLGRVTCKLCGMKASTLDQKKCHVTIHHLGRPLFFCGYCASSFSRKDSCVAHIGAMHSGEKVKFETRHHEFETEIDGWMIQCFGHSGNIDAPGNKCNSSTSNHDVLESLSESSCHKSGSGEGSYGTNEDCGSAGSNQTGDIQQRVSVDKKVYKSSVPSFSVTPVSNWKACCKVCKMEMWTPDQKLQHILKKHMQVNPYFCSLCERSFVSKQGCTQHIRVVHSAPHEPAAEIVDGTSDLSEQISEWQLRCFSAQDQVSFAESRLIPLNKGNQYGLPAKELLKSEHGTEEQVFKFEEVKVTCKKCKMQIDPDGQLSHILRNHIKRNMYFCSYCGYGTREKSNCYKHVEEKHSKLPLKIVDRTDDCFDEIYMWKGLCFPRTGGGTKAFCHECKVTVWTPNKLFHILQCHIERKMYFCSCCGHSCNHRGNCYTHVKTIHYDVPNCEVVDKTVEYLAEIESWKRRCFGNEQSITQETECPKEIMDPDERNNTLAPKNSCLRTVGELENLTTKAEPADSGNSTLAGLCQKSANLEQTSVGLDETYCQAESFKVPSCAEMTDTGRDGGLLTEVKKELENLNKEHNLE